MSDLSLQLVFNNDDDDQKNLHFTPENLLEEKNDLQIGCFASAGGK